MKGYAGTCRLPDERRHRNTEKTGFRASELEIIPMVHGVAHYRTDVSSDARIEGGRCTQSVCQSVGFSMNEFVNHRVSCVVDRQFH